MVYNVYFNIKNMDPHKKFVQLGRERNKITYQLLALLPEIYRKKIYKEKGYATIEEYAGVLAGLSGSVVKKALKLDEKLEDKPCLQKAVETHGVHKVAIVASFATPETDKLLADKVENMSKSSLQELSKEVRGKKQKITIELDEEMQFMFLKLKKELGTSSNQETLRKILKAQQKPKVVTKIPGEKRDNSSKPCSRHVSASEKRELPEKCSYPGCNKPAEVIHHENPFSESRSHDSITPLCKEHHEFVHNGITNNGTLNLDGELKQADRLYRKYRQEALL